MSKPVKKVIEGVVSFDFLKSSRVMVGKEEVMSSPPGQTPWTFLSQFKGRRVQITIETLDNTKQD